MSTTDRIFSFLQDARTDMVDLLTRLVELESPSTDKPALDQLADILACEARTFGGDVDVLVQEHAGNHVRARWGGDGGGGALLLCHMDTVWDLGTVAQRPVRQEGGRLYGPGAYDMKGGIVTGLWALRALDELDLMPAQPITLLLTSDEEVGSQTSRPYIEAEARACDAVFVLEPAQMPGAAVKTSRKGVGNYRVSVSGRAAHAGANHEQGINAIEELARQVAVLQGLTDYGKGTTANVGVIEGGTRSNVVPDQAWAELDVRVVDAAETVRIETAVQGLTPSLAGAEITVTGGINRPPMERTEAIADLFATARSLAAEMGFELAESSSGGGSDGNFTAALGVPTLDGLGVVGDHSHAVDEYVLIDSMAQRSALLAALLRP